MKHAATANKNQLYAITLFFAIAILGILGFLVYPTIVDIGAASQQIIADKNQIYTLDTESQSIAAFQANYKTYAFSLTALNAFFLDPQDPVAFIQFLEKTAAALHSKVGITIIPSDAATKASATHFQIEMKDSFANVLAFSQTLEASPYLVTIDSVTTKKDDKDSALIDAVFIITVANK